MISTQSAVRHSSLTDSLSAIGGATIPVVAVEQPLFARLFIVAQMTGGSLAIFSVRAAPAAIFDDWITTYLRRLDHYDAVFITLLQNIDRRRWSIYEKWWIVNELADRGVPLPFYANIQAALFALRIIQIQGSAVKHG